MLDYKPLEGNSSACPARQACISLAVRDCHRERDSPPEGLSFGFSNIACGGCQSKKDDTEKLSVDAAESILPANFPGSPASCLPEASGRRPFRDSKIEVNETQYSLLFNFAAAVSLRPSKNAPSPATRPPEITTASQTKPVARTR